MDFTEQTKKEVREKSAFRCCRCQKISIEVHHVIPEDGNDINNAAPLCPNCHDDFGENPIKRKGITQMRDWWYEQVKKQFPDNRQLDRLEDISIKLDKLQQNQINLDVFKKELKEFANETINNMTLGTAVTTTSGIANASISSSVSPSKPINEIHSNVVCRKCGTSIGLLIGSNVCPTCGEPITG